MTGDEAGSNGEEIHRFAAQQVFLRVVLLVLRDEAKVDSDEGRQAQHAAEDSIINGWEAKVRRLGEIRLIRCLHLNHFEDTENSRWNDETFFYLNDN